LISHYRWKTKIDRLASVIQQPVFDIKFVNGLLECRNSDVVSFLKMSDEVGLGTLID